MTDSFFSGVKVGRYELVTRLSIGGMAELYLARLEGPGGFQKLVALKMILPDVRQDERFVQMFLDEARMTAALSHPNLGQVFDLGAEPTGELYLAMEFLSGQNLQEVLAARDRQGTPLPVSVTARIVRDLCQGLHAAHTHTEPSGAPRPVVHRDIAPKNVMVTFDGQVKVVDFGIAHASGRRTRTQTGVVKGTPTYMAPEQLAGEPTTPATDIFAAGVVLYECLTGERLFAVNDPHAVFKPVRRTPSQLNPDVSSALDAVCLTALALEPSERFATARDFAKALADAAPGLADEEDLSALMDELFPGKRATIAALAETAKNPNEPSQRVVALARQALTDPAAVKAARRGPVPASEAAAGPTRRVAPERAPRSPSQTVVVAGAGVGVALVLGALAWTSSEAPEAPEVPRPLPALAATEPARPRPAASALQRGAQALDGRRWADALAAFDEVLASNPTNWAALHGSGVALRKLGRAEESVARLAKAEGHRVEVIGARDKAATSLELGLSHVEMGNESLARAALQRAIGIDSGAEERVRTEPDLRRLAELIPLPPTANHTPQELELLAAGKTAKKEKRYKAAIESLNRCLALNPQNAECLVVLASTYAQRGAYDGSEADNVVARRFYERFLTVAHPEDPRRERVREILTNK